MPDENHQPTPDDEHRDQVKRELAEAFADLDDFAQLEVLTYAKQQRAQQAGRRS